MVERMKAVIYCRVSSAKQVTEGHGLASQETRCREYAKSKNYEVYQVFRDEGLSGKLMDRPHMKAMLEFLKTYKNEELIVIIDDISRLARDIETHIHLRSAIAGANGKLVSPSIEFGEDSDSRLVEHLLASVAAHQREKNAEQVKNRMLARMQSGYWCFHAPPGYVFKKVSGHGKLLVRDEPLASVISEALEGFANGLFETQSEIKRFLEASPHFPKSGNGKVHYSRVKELLSKPLYAGYLNYPEWGLNWLKGKHEPIVSVETYQKVQARQQHKAKAPIRKDIRDEFPLRGFLTCGCCHATMTSCFSKGRSKTYPYYLCMNKECDLYGKSIPKEKVESDFLDLLKDMKPSMPLFFASTRIFSDLWDERRARGEEDEKVRRREITKIERQTDSFLDRIVEANSPTVIAAYEKKIAKLENQKAGLENKLVRCGRPLDSFDGAFRTAFSFLSNPQELWLSGRLDYQRTVLKLAFIDKLSYHRDEGFRTASKSLPFLLLEEINNSESGMVDHSVVTSNHLFRTLTEWEEALKRLFAESSNDDALFATNKKSA